MAVGQGRVLQAHLLPSARTGRPAARRRGRRPGPARPAPRPRPRACRRRPEGDEGHLGAGHHVLEDHAGLGHVEQTASHLGLDAGLHRVGHPVGGLAGLAQAEVAAALPLGQVPGHEQDQQHQTHGQRLVVPAHQVDGRGGTFTVRSPGEHHGPVAASC